MIKQILVWVNETDEFRSAALWSIELAQVLSAQVYAVYIMPADVRGKKMKKVDQEEKAWEVLYEIEDEAFERNVRVSLLLETGEPLTRLCQLIASYKSDLLVVSAKCPLSAAELIWHSPTPVLFHKNYKEE